MTNRIGGVPKKQEATAQETRAMVNTDATNRLNAAKMNTTHKPQTGIVQHLQQITGGEAHSFS